MAEKQLPIKRPVRLCVSKKVANKTCEWQTDTSQYIDNEQKKFSQHFTAITVIGLSWTA